MILAERPVLLGRQVKREPEEQRSVGTFEQLRHVKERKATNPYYKNVHSHVLQTVVGDLDKAFQSFFRRVKAGETPGYPRFKGRNRWRSFGFKELGNGFKLDASTALRWRI